MFAFSAAPRCWKGGIDFPFQTNKGEETNINKSKETKQCQGEEEEELKLQRKMLQNMKRVFQVLVKSAESKLNKELFLHPYQMCGVMNMLGMHWFCKYWPTHLPSKYHEQRPPADDITNTQFPNWWIAPGVRCVYPPAIIHFHLLMVGFGYEHSFPSTAL